MGLAETELFASGNDGRRGEKKTEDEWGADPELGEPDKIKCGGQSHRKAVSMGHQGAFVLREDVMDDELRAAVRKYVVHCFGEGLDQMIKDADGGAFVNSGGRVARTKEELVEGVVDMFAARGMAEAFKKYHEEHGCYPELPDLSKAPRMF
jgi:hypothetical protein